MKKSKVFVGRELWPLYASLPALCLFCCHPWFGSATRSRPCVRGFAHCCPWDACAVPCTPAALWWCLAVGSMVNALCSLFLLSLPDTVSFGLGLQGLPAVASHCGRPNLPFLILPSCYGIFPVFGAVSLDLLVSV